MLPGDILQEQTEAIAASGSMNPWSRRGGRMTRSEGAHSPNEAGLTAHEDADGGVIDDTPADGWVSAPVQVPDGDAGAMPPARKAVLKTGSKNDWSRGGGKRSQREGADNMRTVMQAIHPADSSGLHPWEPTKKNHNKLLTAVNSFRVHNDPDVVMHPQLSFNKMLFTKENREELAMRWKDITNSKLDEIPKLWKQFTKFINDWGFVAIRPPDRMSEGFRFGFKFRKEAWNNAGFRLAAAGKAAAVPKEVRARFEDVLSV